MPHPWLVCGPAPWPEPTRITVVVVIVVLIATLITQGDDVVLVFGAAAAVGQLAVALADHLLNPPDSWEPRTP